MWRCGANITPELFIANGNECEKRWCAAARSSLPLKCPASEKRIAECVIWRQRIRIVQTHGIDRVLS